MPNPLKIKALPAWASVLGLALLALALRLAYVRQVHDTALVYPEELDPALYYNWAKEVASGSWLGKDPFVQSPLYAYLLGLLMKVVGSDVTRILVVQSFLGCGTVLLTYWAGRRLFDHRHGLLAGLLIALYGPFLFFEGMIMKTFLSPLLTIALVLLLDRARERGAPRLFALCGVVYGLTTLDRDNFILLAPVLAGLALVMGGGGAPDPAGPGGWRACLDARGLRAAAAFTLGTVLVIAPVTLRNFIVSREIVLLTTGGGEVFFIGNNADANGLYVPPAFVRPDPKFEHADFVARASEIAGGRLSPMQSSWFWFREGMKFITEEPLAWGRLVGLKLKHFWNFYEIPDNLDYGVLQLFSPLLAWMNVSWPPPSWPTLRLPVAGGWSAVRLHLFATFGTVAPLGLVGIFLTRRRWRRLLPLYVLLFGYMATVMLFFNFARFRVPIVPILALFASETLMALGRWLRRAGALAVAFAARSGDLLERARALRPGPQQAVAFALLALLLLGVNVEYPRGVVVAIEQSLVAGNAYYAQQETDKALQSYMTGLVLLGEGPRGPEGEAILGRIGPGVTREALLRELEVESVARGPQFKGMHIGIHHGLGITFMQQAVSLLQRGERPAAMQLLDRAIAQFDEALKLAPAYLLSRRKLARAYSLKGDNAAAIETLTKATEDWPDDLDARMELAELLFDNGDFKAALRNLDEARSYNRDLEATRQADVYFYRGLVFFRGLGDPGKALFDFEKVLELNPAHPQAREVASAVSSLRRRGVQPVADEPPAPAPPAGAPTRPPARPTARPGPSPSGP